ncbi:MAG: 6-bladed beta-propeller [Tannerella sp.]|jgi:hypothetical protein|nr:6-bladed beta-propeller [Tannerella sp.]
MKTVKVWIGLAVVLLLVSCTQKEKSDSKSEIVRININLSDKTEVYDIGTDVEPEWDICALETNDDCLLGFVRQIYYKNDLYYILDLQASVILVFNREGEFVSKLDKKGGGPDDYIQINSFTVVGKNVWVAGGTDLICYDENWHAIERQRLTIFPVGDMLEINNTIYLATNWRGHNCQLVEYDIASKQQNCLITLPKYDPNIFKIEKSSQLTLSGDGVNSLFVQNFCDTIFRISDHRVAPQYRFSFSERYEDIPIFSMEEVVKPTDKIRGILGMYKTPNGIILSFIDKTLQYAVYNEEKATCRVCTKFGYAGLGNLTSPGGCYFTHDGEMIWMYDRPEELLAMIDESKIKNEADRQKIHAVLSNIKEDDNPVLFRFKLKKDAGL